MTAVEKRLAECVQAAADQRLRAMTTQAMAGLDGMPYSAERAEAEKLIRQSVASLRPQVEKQLEHEMVESLVATAFGGLPEH